MGLWAWIRSLFSPRARSFALEAKRAPRRHVLGDIFAGPPREIASVAPLVRPSPEVLLLLEGSEVAQAPGGLTYGWNSQPLISFDAAVLEWGLELTRNVFTCCVEWIQDPDHERGYDLARAPLIQRGSSLDLVQYRSDPGSPQGSHRVARPAHRRLTDMSRTWLSEGCRPFLLREVDLTPGWLWALMLFAGKENLFITTIYFSRMPGIAIERAQHIPGHPRPVVLAATWESLQTAVSDVFRTLEVTSFIQLRRREATSQGSLRELDAFVEQVLRELRYPPREHRIMWREREPRAAESAAGSAVDAEPVVIDPERALSEP